MAVVLPVPGGPWNKKCGIFALSCKQARNAVTASSCDCIADRVRGLYFSTHGISLLPLLLSVYDISFYVKLVQYTNFFCLIKNLI